MSENQKIRIVMLDGKGSVLIDEKNSSSIFPVGEKTARENTKFALNRISKSYAGSDFELLGQIHGDLMEDQISNCFLMILRHERGHPSPGIRWVPIEEMWRILAGKEDGNDRQLWDSAMEGFAALLQL